MIVIREIFTAIYCCLERRALRQEEKMNPFYEKRNQKLMAVLSENMRFPEHLHGHMEILLVLEGQIGVKIMGEEQCLKEGDCAVVFPEQIHSYFGERKHRVLLLILDPALSGPYMRVLQTKSPASPFLPASRLSGEARLAWKRLYELAGGNGQLFLAEAENAGRTEAESAGRTEAEGTKQTEKGGTDPDKAGDKPAERPDEAVLKSAWFQVLLAHLMPVLEPRERRGRESMELTDRLLTYVAEHFQEQLTLERLSRELHVNKYYISHLFAERLQMNFRQYLNHIRLEYALQMMDATDWPMTRVWEEAGFNSQRSFNRCFRENMGMAPTEYRKKM